jgi:hypothetical protein
VGVLTLLEKLAPGFRWLGRVRRRALCRLKAGWHFLWGFFVTLGPRWRDYRTRGSWTPAVGDYIRYGGYGQVDSALIVEEAVPDEIIDSGQMWVKLLGFGVQNTRRLMRPSDMKRFPLHEIERRRKLVAGLYRKHGDTADVIRALEALGETWPVYSYP